MDTGINQKSSKGFAQAAGSQQRDVARMVPFTPEDQQGGVTKVVAVLLSSLPYHARRQVADAAKSLALSDVKTYPMPMVFAAIPKDAPLDLARALVHGQAGIVAARQSIRGDEEAKTSVEDLDQIASSILSGFPMGGDPTSGASLPTLATTFLDAAAQGDIELTPELKMALDVCSEYDCCQHQLPFGGDIFGIGKWLKGTFGSAEDKAAYQAEKAAKAQSKAAAAAAKTNYLQSLLGMDKTAGDEDDASLDSSASSGRDGGSLSEIDLAGAVKNKAQQLEEFKEALGGAKSQLEEKQRETNATAEQLARLTLAQQVLEAPSGVIELLEETRPDFSSEGGLLEFAKDVMLSAQASGKPSVLRRLTRLITNMSDAGGASRSLVARLFGGDVISGTGADDPDNRFAEEAERVFQAIAEHDSLAQRPWTREEGVII